MTETRADGAQTGEGTILFGGSGFLGSCILENYPEVISVGRTAPRTSNHHIHVAALANLEVLSNVAFNKVIYIIGNSDRYNMEKEHIPIGDPTPFDYHLVPLLQVLEQLKHYKIKKFIHFSTIVLYDEKKIRLPVSEQAPIDPYKNRYVFSKYLGEEACKFYQKWIPIISVRLSNMFGPTHLHRFDLIHLLVRQLLNNGKGEVASTKPERDFIFVEDAARAIVKLLETDYTGLLNLGTGTMTAVREIVDTLREISGCPITDLDQPVEGPMQFRCDMTTLQELIDWTPRYSTVAGVRQTYELMKSWRQR
ncbi:MAG: NAD-dependent epimerase/dehydratase family protein [Pyrinomonadaceae bacterium]